jgi:hypothetical protein
VSGSLPEVKILSRLGPAGAALLQTRSDRECEELLEAIRGRGAFRLFKVTLRRMGAEADWYAFRDNALKEIARE